MIEALMIHDELSTYFDFLGLRVFKCMHEYHYYKESIGYRNAQRYILSHYNRLLGYVKVDNPEVIPSSWENYSRQEVDTQTKQQAVKNAMEMWVKWERDTLKLYEQLYSELIANDDICAGLYVADLIKDVSEEVKAAELLHIELSTLKYDILAIAEMQDELHKKYGEIIKEMEVCYDRP